MTRRAGGCSDAALQSDPSRNGIRFLKALALINDARNDDGYKLLKELSEQQIPFAPALFKLGQLNSESEEEAGNSLVWKRTLCAYPLHRGQFQQSAKRASRLLQILL
mgnify:CR=1 FL=1